MLDQSGYSLYKSVEAEQAQRSESGSFFRKAIENFHCIVRQDLWCWCATSGLRRSFFSTMKIKYVIALYALFFCDLVRGAPNSVRL